MGIISKADLKPEERTKCEIWTRAMGFYRPVSRFNIGKKGEFKERKFFTEEKAETSVYKNTTISSKIAA